MCPCVYGEDVYYTYYDTASLCERCVECDRPVIRE